MNPVNSSSTLKIDQMQFDVLSEYSSNHFDFLVYRQLLTILLFRPPRRLMIKYGCASMDAIKQPTFSLKERAGEESRHGLISFLFWSGNIRHLHSTMTWNGVDIKWKYFIFRKFSFTSQKWNTQSPDRTPAWVRSVPSLYRSNPSPPSSELAWFVSKF